MSELRFDYLARPALLGLLFRALAGSAEAGRAAITRRSIEQMQAQRTEHLKERSRLTTDVQTALTRLQSAQRTARDARLDVQIFTENNPPPQDNQPGLLGRRKGPKQREWEKQREHLALLAKANEAEAAEYSAIHSEIVVRLQELQEAASALELEYQTQLDLLRSQLNAWVLLQLSASQGTEAREQLAEFRRLLRGELSVAVLLVLTELLEHGTQTTGTVLSEVSSIWEQHPDPLRQVLEALLHVLRDGGLQRREAKMFQREQFSQPGHWNLYRLTRVLGGWPVDLEDQNEGNMSATLWALEQVLLTQSSPANWEPQSAQGLAAWSSGADCLIQLMCCLALWQRGEAALIPLAAGLPFNEIRHPEKRGESWPDLYSSLARRPLTGWPEPLAGAVWSELSCLVLLAAKQHAPEGLYRHWLAESYNWPKSALFWWSMAQLQQDQALLNRAADCPAGLIALCGMSL